MVAADLEVDGGRRQRFACRNVRSPGRPLKLPRVVRRARGLKKALLHCADPLLSYVTRLIRVGHDRENVLLVRLAAPPSAAADVSDAQPGLIMNPLYEHLFDCNGSLRYGRVMQPTESGRMLHAEGHEAAALVDSGTSLVVEQEIAGDTNAARH